MRCGMRHAACSGGVLLGQPLAFGPEDGWCATLPMAPSCVHAVGRNSANSLFPTAAAAAQVRGLWPGAVNGQVRGLWPGAVMSINVTMWRAGAWPLAWRSQWGCHGRCN